jgi:hypothetical protein
MNLIRCIHCPTNIQQIHASSCWVATDFEYGFAERVFDSLAAILSHLSVTLAKSFQTDMFGLPLRTFHRPHEPNLSLPHIRVPTN